MYDLSRHFDKADKHLQRGKPELALECYMAALQEEPRDERSREAAADVCLSLNQTARASELLAGLLRDYMLTLNIDKAVPMFRKLQRAGRPDPDLTLEFAQMVERTNKKQAVEAYDQVVKTFIQSGRHIDAMRVYEHIVLVEPSAENFRKQGELALQCGKNSVAANAFVRWAVALERAEIDGSEAFERAYVADPTNMAACLGHGRTLVARGRAAEAVSLLEPIAAYPSAPIEAREPYAMALLAAGRTIDAAPFVWELFERDPQQHTSTVTEVLSAILSRGQGQRAVELARKTADFQRKAGRRREFIAQMKEIADAHSSDTHFLEFMAELYNESNREADFTATLARLFDLYFAERNYRKACAALERAVQVDAYEPGHRERLERLRGKVDAPRLNTIANDIGLNVAEEQVPVAETADDHPTVLEDLILQAEIFLQYGMRPKALDRIERIAKLFPREEENDERLRDLYLNAGFQPSYAGEPPGAAAAAKPVSGAPSATPATREEDFDDLTRSAEVNRNISRQTAVKSVLFTAVNDVGRNWNASRCIAGLCMPGKPPSAALEYCAPGVRPSDVNSVVKLIMTLQAVCAAQGGPVIVGDATAAPELAALSDVVKAFDIGALLAVPMLEGDDQVGILILQQCGDTRQWRSAELAVLRTIADQMVMAVNNARLRSLVKNLAVTDEKSGLLKRSSYFDVTMSEVQRALQSSSPLTVVLLSFGKASSMIREYGDAAVERMMQEIAQTISSHVRQNDVGIRYEMTEVALLLADTGEKNAFLAVEKLRRALSSIRLPGKDHGPALSAGIAEALLVREFEPVDIVTEVVNRVEAALAISKLDPRGAVNSLAPQLASSSAAD